MRWGGLRFAVDRAGAGRVWARRRFSGLFLAEWGSLGWFESPSGPHRHFSSVTRGLQAFVLSQVPQSEGPFGKLRAGSGAPGHDVRANVRPAPGSRKLEVPVESYVV